MPSAPGLPLVGLGVDVHRYCLQPSERPARLACLEWPGERALEGHSDGDAVAHAIVDALAGAAGLGDIGSLFGTSNPAWAGAAGADFLRQTKTMVESAGYQIGNVAVVVIANQPRLGPRRVEAETILSDLIGAPVRLTATTTDGLGLTGRGEGVAAIATAAIGRI